MGHFVAAAAGIFLTHLEATSTHHYTKDIIESIEYMTLHSIIS